MRLPPTRTTYTLEPNPGSSVAGFVTRLMRAFGKPGPTSATSATIPAGLLQANTAILCQPLDRKEWPMVSCRHRLQHRFVQFQFADSVPDSFTPTTARRTLIPLPRSGGPRFRCNRANRANWIFSVYRRRNKRSERSGLCLPHETPKPRGKEGWLGARPITSRSILLLRTAAGVVKAGAGSRQASRSPPRPSPRRPARAISMPISSRRRQRCVTWPRVTPMLRSQHTFLL